MADKTAFEIPDQMRAFADKSVDQAKKAFDDFMNATARAVEKAETSAKSMQEGAHDVNRQAIAFLEQNVAASFEFAQKMVRARTIEELGQIQQAYLQKQVEAVQIQTKGLSDTISRTTAETSGRTGNQG